MNKSLLISIIALYGAATMGCADDVMGRAPINPAGSAWGFALDFKKMWRSKRFGKSLNQ